MKIKSFTLGIITVTVIFGMVFLSDVIGYWATESRKEPSEITTGEFAGENNPADIRGSYSLADIEKAFRIPVKTLANAFGIPESGAEIFQLKSLEVLYGSLAEEGTEIGTSSVRYFVALYTGLPYEAGETIYLPRQAVDLLISEGLVSGDEIEKLKAISVELTTSSQI